MNVMELQGHARRVPEFSDPIQWPRFRAWLGYSEVVEPDVDAGAVVITTPAAKLTAKPGDWLIRTLGGELHLGRDCDA